MRRLLPIIAYAALVLSGCMQGSEPLTAEDRCAILCNGNDGAHPCRDEEPTDSCVTQCTSHITPLTGDCLTCVLTMSGWIAEACVCKEVDDFGMLNQECKDCSFTTHQTNCANSTTCTKDSETCEGYKLVNPTDTVCAPACG